MVLVPNPGEPPAGPWWAEPVARLARTLLGAADPGPRRPRIVAVDGRSGGGQTTLTEVLVAPPFARWS